MTPLRFLRRLLPIGRTRMEAAILTALDGDIEASGAEISRRIDAALDRSVSIGSLYVVLSHMERSGALTSRWGVATAERGWRRPRLYRKSVTLGDAGEGKGG